jgi:hypothetical protein
MRQSLKWVAIAVLIQRVLTFVLFFKDGKLDGRRFVVACSNSTLLSTYIPRSKSEDQSRLAVYLRLAARSIGS